MFHFVTELISLTYNVEVFHQVMGMCEISLAYVFTPWGCPSFDSADPKPPVYEYSCIETLDGVLLFRWVIHSESNITDIVNNIEIYNLYQINGITIWKFSQAKFLSRFFLAITRRFRLCSHAKQRVYRARVSWRRL